MTRRKFIQKLLGAASVVCAGVCGLVKKVTPRRFVRAAGVKKYPGSVRSLPNTYNQGKWSG